MKGIFSVFILLTFFSSIKAQPELFGKYKFYSENDAAGSLVLNCDKTFYMEDTMVISKDSLVTSIVKGAWKIRKSKRLVLFVDSIISRSNPVGNLKKLRYWVRSGRLYLKPQTQNEYKRQNKKLCKKYNICTPVTREDYEKYKERQMNRYFLMVDIFPCK